MKALVKSLGLWNVLLVGMVVVMLPSAFASAADNYPTKPISIVVPYAAGSGADLVTRIFSSHLSKYIGQPVIIVNRANTVQGEIEVGNARPDGYTLGCFGTGGFTLAKYLGSVYPDIAKFDVLVQIIAESRVLAVSEVLGIKTVKELVEYGRKNPKKLLVAINPGTTSHLDTVAVIKAMGIEANYIPFKSGAERAVALSGGHAHVTMDMKNALQPYVDAKKMRILGVGAPKRIELYQDIPTLREQGVNADSLNVMGIFAPKGMPEAVQQVLEAGVEKAANDPETREQLRRMSIVPEFMNRRDFAKAFSEESARIEVAARELGLANAPKK